MLRTEARPVPNSDLGDSVIALSRIKTLAQRTRDAQRERPPLTVVELLERLEGSKKKAVRRKLEVKRLVRALEIRNARLKSLTEKCGALVAYDLAGRLRIQELEGRLNDILVPDEHSTNPWILLACGVVAVVATIIVYAFNG